MKISIQLVLPTEQAPPSIPVAALGQRLHHRDCGAATLGLAWGRVSTQWKDEQSGQKDELVLGSSLLRHLGQSSQEPHGRLEEGSKSPAHSGCEDMEDPPAQKRPRAWVVATDKGGTPGARAQPPDRKGLSGERTPGPPTTGSPPTSRYVSLSSRECRLTWVLPSTNTRACCALLRCIAGEADARDEEEGDSPPRGLECREGLLKRCPRHSEAVK